MHLALSTSVAIRMFPRDAEGPVLLCDRSAALASLGLVHQAFAGIELLLTR